MAEKSVAEKLLIKRDSSFWVSDASRRALLEPLPEGAREAASAGYATTAVIFAADANSLRSALKDQRAALLLPANVWVAYPKANRSDINRDTVWPIVGEYGLRPIGQVAVDEVWSALRFRALKPGEAPFTGGKA